MHSTQTPTPWRPRPRPAITWACCLLALTLAGEARRADAFFLTGGPTPLLRRHLSPYFPLHDYDDYPSLISPRHMIKTMHALEHEADKILAGILESAPASATAGNVTTEADARPSHTELRLRPRFDVEDNADAFLLTAATPGLQKEDLSVEVVDGADGAAYLIVAGHTSTHAESDGSGDGPAAESGGTAPSASPASAASLPLKAFYSKFERKIKLPPEVERDQVRAAYENGLLSVTIPKNAKRQALKLRVPIS